MCHHQCSEVILCPVSGWHTIVWSYYFYFWFFSEWLIAHRLIASIVIKYKKNIFLMCFHLCLLVFMLFFMAHFKVYLMMCYCPSVTSLFFKKRTGVDRSCSWRSVSINILGMFWCYIQCVRFYRVCRALTIIINVSARADYCQLWLKCSTVYDAADVFAKREQ